MKVINLVNSPSSDIKYEISTFPDGQHQVTINHFERSLLIEECEIYSRLNSWVDLEIITCAIASLRELGVERINLFIPYVLGARSDRKFSIGSSNYLKSVICPIINTLNLNRVTVLDPHSDCLEMGINNYRKISNSNIVKTAIQRIFSTEVINNGMYFICSPDAGALKKIYNLSEEIGYTGGIIKGDKHRDTSGSIVSTGISYPKRFFTEDLVKDIIIVDDICDGGRTFIELAKALRQAGHTGKFHLVVSHGIFSKGFEELKTSFESIFTTNSCGKLDRQPKMWVHNDSAYLLESNLLTVLDIFE